MHSYRYWMVSLAMVVTASTSAHCESAHSAETDCTSLSSLQTPPEAIGEPTKGAKITSAAMSPAGDPNGSYCKVLGEVLPVDAAAPKLFFEVNLPAEWNGKAVQMGGAAFDGVLITGLENYANAPASSPTPLKSGYVTLGSDSGHQRNDPQNGFEAIFALNDEALANFAQLSIKKTKDVAAAIIRARYGKPSSRFYFIGRSEGGDEALMAAQRYPADYDGVIAAYPAYNKMVMLAGMYSFSSALYADHGKGWVNPKKADLLVKNVYAACDPLDGIRDGIISNVKACQVATKPFKSYDSSNPLRCTGGADLGDSCLSDNQIAALNQIDSPSTLGFVASDNISTFPKWTPFEGSTFRDIPSPSQVPFMLGLSDKPSGIFTAAYGPVSDAFQYLPVSSIVKYLITKNPSIDPLLQYNHLAWKDRILQLEPLIDANDAELAGFRKRGGKMIIFHGAIDDLITPYNSMDYYDRVVKKNGQGVTDGFLKFYVIPGMGHETGVFAAQIDTLSALEKWVEQGVAPGELTAVDGNAPPSGGRTRPVCPYGKWPKYVGGDERAAASFACTAGN